MSGEQSAFMPARRADEEPQDIEPDFYGRAVVTDRLIRCVHVMPSGMVCNKFLALIASRPWRIQCPRCHALNQAGIGLEESN